jgi:endonuclease/exonuclease/phosphatase family metal-dependent hydrolase
MIKGQAGGEMTYVKWAWAYWCLSTLLLFWVTGVHAQAGAASGFPDWEPWHVEGPQRYTQRNVPGTPGFTMRTVVRLGDGFREQVALLTMGTLSSHPTSDPDVLQIGFMPDPASWVGWIVTLQSQVGVVPVDPQNDKKAPVDLGSLTHRLDLAKIGPRTGVSYELLLGYDARTATVSIAVTDDDSAQPLYKGTVRLPDHLQNVWAGVGVRNTGEHASTDAVHFEVLDVSASYQPVATDWSVGVPTDNGDVVPRTRIGLHEELVIQVKPPFMSDLGQYRLVWRANGQSVVLGYFGRAPASDTIRLLPGHLSPGKGQLDLEFVDDGRVARLASQAMDVGSMTVTVEEMNMDRNEPTIVGEIKLATEAPVSAVHVEVNATVTEWRWDARQREYEQLPRDTYTLLSEITDLPGEGGLALPYSIALPEQPGIWSLEFSVAGTMRTQLEVKSRRRLFSTTGHSDGGPSRLVRICSYNMYDLQGWPLELVGSALGTRWGDKRVQHFADVIRGLDCDVLGIQEGGNHALLERLAPAAGVNSALFNRPNVLPGAVLTKHVILEKRDFRSSEKTEKIPFSRTAGAAKVDIHGRPMWIVNIHAHPSDQRLRDEEARILGERIDELLETSEDIVVMGDFNSLYGTIIHNALLQRGFLNTMIISGGGLVSTMNTTKPRALDHIYVSPSLIGNVRSSYVIQDYDFAVADAANPDHWVHSDHLPVVAELEIR